VSATLDARELRRLMANWATGVAVITSTDGSGPRGATTNALTSLSLEPLLVLVALDHASNTLEAVRHSGRFCINVLAADQEELARRFATKASGEEKLAGRRSRARRRASPSSRARSHGSPASSSRELGGGDHTILIGRPLEGRLRPRSPPLVFYGGRYPRRQPRRSVAPPWQSSGAARSCSTWTAC
jgi:flavin reductase (DIM6/NTAB) family NADH-FMN oxidoreductase RutF